MSYQYSPRVNSLIHWFRKARRVVASRSFLNRAHMRRNTVAHKAKFAARMQLKCAICRKAATILPNFVAWILNPLKECGRKCKFYRRWLAGARSNRARQWRIVAIASCLFGVQQLHDGPMTLIDRCIGVGRAARVRVRDGDPAEARAADNVRLVRLGKFRFE